MPLYLYTPLYRPPSWNCLPPGWTLVERPTSTTNFDRRIDLPVSVHPHGVISYPRPLTSDEIDNYQLKVLS